MNRSRLTSAVVALAVCSTFAIPVVAAQDGHRGGGGARAEGHGRQEGQARAQAVPRTPQPRFDQRFDQPRAIQPQPRFEQPRAIPPQQRFEQPRAIPPQQRFEQPRAIQPQQRFEGRRFEQPRAIQPQQRFEERRFEQPRAIQPQQRFGERRFEQPRAIQPQQRFEGRRFDDRRFERRGFAQPRVFRPGFSRPYYRPYYTFRPRLSLGFGLWLGYPILYSSYGPDYYPYPYVYASPYARSTYPAPAPGTVVPSGGLSFDITPSDAEIYVDGQYVGAVGEFSPSEQPLPLTPGRHRLEIGAPGYQTLVFDVDIIAGQVMPYQGSMQPQ